MPVFWIGFNLLIFPACRANQRFGGIAVMTGGCGARRAGGGAAASAPSLEAWLRCNSSPAAPGLRC
jgi:hypothetical protein